MFNSIKKWYYKKCAEREIGEAYVPLFVLRKQIEEGLKEAIDTLKWLEDSKIKLIDPTGKNASTAIKEKWQAIQLETAIEHYKLAIIKLSELHDNLPEIERETEYDTVYYDDNS